MNLTQKILFWKKIQNRNAPGSFQSFPPKASYWKIQQMIFLHTVYRPGPPSPLYLKSEKNKVMQPQKWWTPKRAKISPPEWSPLFLNGPLWCDQWWFFKKVIAVVFLMEFLAISRDWSAKFFGRTWLWGSYYIQNYITWDNDRCHDQFPEYIYHTRTQFLIRLLFHNHILYKLLETWWGDCYELVRLVSKMYFRTLPYYV